MRKTVRNIFGVVAIVAISAGVAGVTSYKLLQKDQSTGSSFGELFPQNTSYHAASFSGVQGQPVDLTVAAETAIHSVVHIRSTQLSRTQTVQQMPDIFDFFFGDGSSRQRQIQTQPRVGFGSGVIISKDGYIVTNNHVVEGADEIAVKLNDDRELKGRIIGTDPSTDLALIKVEGDDELPAIQVGNSDALKVGEWVLAVGNPFNLSSTVTAGIVSAKARSLGGGQAANGQAPDIQSFIQTDAAINQGNSGGALVNARGELVGINAMLYSPTGADSGYGFAIPTSIMTKVVADLKQFGAVQRALLGVSCTDLNISLVADENSEAVKEIKEKCKELGIKEGIWVRQVVEGGSAAGILKENDVITAIEGRQIHKFSDMQEVLAQKRPGEKIKLSVIRDKQKKEFTVELKNAQGNTKVVKSADMDLLGATFKPVSAELKKQLNLGYGIEVTGVSQGRIADAGIRRGFIILKANNTLMKSADDLEKVFKAASQTPEQAIFISGIYPSGKRANYLVDLNQE